MLRVAVLGAGVVGSSIALHLARRFPGALALTLISDKFHRCPPSITSGTAATILLPPDPADNQGIKDQRSAVKNASTTERVKKWSRATMSHFNSIYQSQDNAQVQLCLQQGYIIFESKVPDPWYKDEVFGFRHVDLDSVEARLIHIPPSCVDVWAFSTYTVEMANYLQWLHNQAYKRNIRLQQRRITTFEELSYYDIIVNCTGLASCQLANDNVVKTQSVCASAPWIKQFLIFIGNDKLNFNIFPRAKNLVFGSTTQAKTWNDILDSSCSVEDILKQCKRFFPSLDGAEMIDTWSSLDPYRDPIRLESCEGPADNLLVHCYGHRGQGMILSWGSAEEVGNVIEQTLHG